MKVLYAGMHANRYGAPPDDESFEYRNFYQSFTAIAGLTAIEHPFDDIIKIGKRAWNKELVRKAREERPNLFFTFMYTDELEPAGLRVIRDELKIPTIAWFADDYWRFWNYSRHWAPHFSYVVTTSPQAALWYRAAGHANIIESQWACNTAFYTPQECARDIPVSFVGQMKSGRRAAIDRLQRANIAVRTFGSGWPSGRVSSKEMLDIFSRSAINLNLNIRPGRFEPSVLARIFLKKSINRLALDFSIVQNVRAWWHFALPHTHARPFELAGCRAFVISGYSEGIERYYKPDKEMVFYRTTDELLEKVRYYLSHEKERLAIAENAFRRTQAEHTYEKRFMEIFRCVGL